MLHLISCSASAAAAGATSVWCCSPCPAAEPHTVTACCHAAALQALRAQVAALEATIAEITANSEAQDQELQTMRAEVAGLEVTNAAITTNSETQRLELQAASEVSPGRMLQQLLL
jgi:hypothetical protein